MAISPKDQLPPLQIDVSDPTGYPLGKAQNQTVPGDGLGTPWHQLVCNDIFGFQQALLAAAGLTASGTPDKVGASQYLNSLMAILGVDIQVLGANGTWNKPAGGLVTSGFLVGGGASGSAGQNDGSNGGGGGGSGYLTEFTVPTNQLASTATVVVGAGGAGVATGPGAGTGPVGNNGGLTSFSSGSFYAWAAGGKTGTSYSVGGDGYSGGGSGGDSSNFNGGDGGRAGSDGEQTGTTPGVGAGPNGGSGCLSGNGGISSVNGGGGGGGGGIFDILSRVGVAGVTNGSGDVGGGGGLGAGAGGGGGSQGSASGSAAAGVAIIITRLVKPS